MGGKKEQSFVCLERHFFFFLSVAKEATRFGQLYENKVSTIALPHVKERNKEGDKAYLSCLSA